MWELIHALYGSTSVEGLVLCIVTQEVHNQQETGQVATSMSRRLGSLKELELFRLKAEERHAKKSSYT